MEKQTIMWTALPNGVTMVEGRPMLNLSVYCSFRLMSTTAGSKKLSTYPDLLDWGTRMKSGVSFRVEFGGGPTIAATLKKDQIDPGLWPLLFTGDSPVTPYEFEDLSTRLIHSYPVKNVESFIRNQYTDVAIENPTEFPDGNVLMKRLEPIRLFHYGPEKPIPGAPIGKTPVLQGISRQGLVQDSARFSPKVRAAIDRQSASLLKTPTTTLKTPAAKTYQTMMQEMEKSRVVKNGPPDPTKDFLQLTMFHAPQGAPSKKPAGKGVYSPIERIKPVIPEMEFHEAVSSLGDYPALLRNLGIVLDLLVPIEAGIPASSTVRVKPEMTAPYGLSTVSAMPKSAYKFSASSFTAVPKGGSSDLKDGLLNLANTSAFDVVQLDVDGAALKLLNLAATIEQLDKIPAPPAPPVLADAGSGEGGIQAALGLSAEMVLAIPQKISLPSLRSAGISIVRANRPQMVVAAIDASNTHNALLKKAEEKLLVSAPKGTVKSENVETILYADDLVRGYRVDVWSSETSKWHSLCMRKGKFHLLRRPGTDIVVSEEGIVGMAATEAADGSSDDLKVGEPLFRWDGWSMVAPRPGKTIAPDDTVQKIENKSHTPYGLEVGMTAEAGTLPRLRFGTRYRLRARSVDLAGNSLTLEACEPRGFDAATAEKTYLRHEPVASPMMLLRTGMKPGESLETITIRSNYDKTVDEYAAAHSLSGHIPERHVVAPKTTELMAETHSRFDGMNPAAAYTLITGKDGNFSPPADPVNPEAHFDAASTVISQESVTLPYLPDPIARAASLTFYDRKRKQIGAVRVIDFYSGGTTWPEAVSFRLRLVEGTGEPAWEKDGPRILTVYVPKAERIVMRYACALPSELLWQQAIWNWVEEKNPPNLSNLRSSASEGKHWMLTPFREAILVHPVQQPMEEPKIVKLAATKGLNETFARLHGNATFHGLSTARVDLRAEWQEPVDDVTLPEPTTIEGKAHVLDAAPGEDHAGMTMGKPDTPLQQPGDPPAGELNLLLFPVTPLKTVRSAGLQSNVSAAQIGGLVSGVQPQQPPGAQKSIQMSPAAAGGVKGAPISMDYLPPLIPMGPAFSHFRAEKGLLAPVIPMLDLGARKHEFGDTRTRKVKYTAIATTRFREHFLDLIYPPTSTRAEAKPEESAIPLTREGSIEVRVLNSARPAIPRLDYVIPTFTWEKKEDDVTVISRRCGGGLRVYLERPWYSSGDGELLGVLLNPTGQFVDEGDPLRAYVTQWGLDPIWKSSGGLKSAPTLGDFTAASAKNTNVVLDEIAGKSLHVAGHECTYDKERRLWVADVVLSPGGAYFPFVRLALARYQPNSVAKAHISRVVMTDFIQLVPDRTAAVTVDSPTKVTVQVAGVYGLRTAQDLASPAQLKGHQYFTAVLEKKTGSGSFDWVPVKPESPAQQTMTMVPDLEGLTPTKQYGAKMVWGRELVIAQPVLRRGTGEYRVVIKEFEAYQTSNTQTGTRLVYVDTIEL